MCDDVRGLFLILDDGFGCEDLLAGRRVVVEFKLFVEIDLLLVNDVLSCKLLGVEVGDCFGVEFVDKLFALCREGFLERLVLIGLFSGFGNEDGFEGDFIVEFGCLVVFLDGIVGSFLLFEMFL